MACLLAALLTAGGVSVRAADPTGVVTFGGLPVPGATITATQDDRRITTVSDTDGVFRLPSLDEGVWTVRVEKAGFRPITRELPAAASGAADVWELVALAVSEIPDLVRLAGVAGAGTAGPTSGLIRLEPELVRLRSASLRADEPDTTETGEGSGGAESALDADTRALQGISVDDVLAAADGMLVHGSINNAAATPFAQPRAFGNNRPGRRWPYNLTTGTLLGTSAWDARPYSLTAQQTPRPDYHNVHLSATFGGPIQLPRLRTRGNFYLGYERASDSTASTQWALMPTARERAGDFSQTRDARGHPVVVRDPETGLPFPGNVIPPERLSPQAAALLGYYPLPTDEEGGRFNYQTPILSDRRQDSVQTRLSQTVRSGTSLQVTANYQRGSTDRSTLFGFPDAGTSSGFSSDTSWTQRLSPMLSLRASYQFSRQHSRTVPHFARVRNVSAEAGIAGNNQDPDYWGPPRLSFGSGVAGLADSTHALSRSHTHTWAVQTSWSTRRRHALTFGAEVRRSLLDVESQQNARGTFAFTGAASGSDFADFLLGQPHTSTIAFGNPDKFFRASSLDLYIADDWRIRAGLTANVGVRWEYDTPVSERFNRLVNLDVAPDFSAALPVLAGESTGPVTGRPLPASLVRPDRLGVQPRLGIAWRPLAASSLVIRGGYGIYRVRDVYQSIAALMAQQPPLSTAGSLERSESVALTLADGFPLQADRLHNTFAVDPDFRPGYAHNWQASVQRDLPRSLTVMATYLGTKGSRLVQQFLPNTWPAGAEPSCAGCPTGFVYLTSNGGSQRDALQLQLRRRLHNGFTATLEYTIASAHDNATSFGGASLGGSIAQNWLDLDAEYAPSSFDQRHLAGASAQYTTGARVFGSRLFDGWKGTLVRDWTFSGQLSTGSGLPLTPMYFAPVRGTGIIGPVRASLTGAPVDDIPGGYYLNPAAYGPPAPGEWGDAGRNSVTGPRTFSLDAAVARTFRAGGRVNLDWRLTAANVLNRVTWTAVNTSVTSPQFGLATGTGGMRRVRMSVRMRF